MARERFRQFKIEVRVWNTNAYVITGGEARDWRRTLEAGGIPEREREYWIERMEKLFFGRGQYGAVVLLSDDVPWHVYLFFPVTPRQTSIESIAAVAHECFHAAIAILRRRQVDLTRESEEAFTYLSEHLVRSVWEMLAKRRAD